MTEAEWLSATDPDMLLDHLAKLKKWEGIQTSERKLRLIACAFCRRLWHLMPDELSRSTVELCEYYVDGLADPQPLWERGGFSTTVPEHIYDEATIEYEAYFAARFVGYRLAVLTGPAAHSPEEGAAGLTSKFATRAAVLSGMSASESARGQCIIIRDIIANLFRRSVHNPAYCAGTSATLVAYQSICLDPSWLTSTVLSLATGIYAERAFDRLPILADALQDAGCEHTEILDHCRGLGPHARGCWVVDLVLAKN
jgi:hypothetical protein